MNHFHCALAVSVVAFAGCDKMKNMIDPSGKSYGGNVDTTKKFGSPAKPAEPAKSSAPKPAQTTPPPAPRVSAPGGKAEVVIHQKAPGRFLTATDVERQIPDITFQAAGRSFKFAGSLYRDRSGITSLRDSARVLWGVGIGDLNMDGSDDAVLLLRTDKPGSVVWDLAYLPNRGGKLANVQTVRLPGDQGYREVVVEGSTVILVPEAEGGNVHLGYSGGELSVVGM